MCVCASAEFEVEEIPDQNLLVETLQLFWTEQKFSLGERDKTVPEAIFKKITLNALSMRTEASITVRIVLFRFILSIYFFVSLFVQWCAL